MDASVKNIPDYMSADVMAKLKRDREEAKILDSWVPGAGVPCYTFGPSEDRTKKERLLRTSLLFLQLEVFSFLNQFHLYGVRLRVNHVIYCFK